MLTDQQLEFLSKCYQFIPLPLSEMLPVYAPVKWFCTTVQLYVYSTTPFKVQISVVVVIVVIPRGIYFKSCFCLRFHSEKYIGTKFVYVSAYLIQLPLKKLIRRHRAVGNLVPSAISWGYYLFKFKSVLFGPSDASPVSSIFSFLFSHFLIV